MSNINAKLKRYALLTAGVTIAGTKVAKAQVRYTDIPDVNIDWSNYFVDLDQDGSGDFLLYNYYYDNTIRSFSAANIGFVKFTGSVANTRFADKLDLNEVISASSEFTTDNNRADIGHRSSTAYAWTGGETNKYLGVRINISGQWHYGWVKLSTDIRNDNMTVHDFAYNTVPGQQIAAGFTGQPTIDTNTGATVSNGGSVTISNTDLNIADSDNLKSDVTVTITGGPTNGQFENSDNPSVAITSFTQQDIDDGKISYKHNGTATTTDQITFSYAGGQSTAITGATFNLTISPPDVTAPVVATNTGTSVDEGASVNITTAMLSATDNAADNADITFTVNSGPANGQLENSDNTGVAITSFTQEELADGKISYVHDGTDTTSGDFNFTVDDGASNSAAAADFTITVNAVDDTAPVVATNTGTSVDEGASVNITTAMLSATDSEADDADITFTVNSGPANGQLENSDNTGVAITSFTQEELADGKISYVHDGSDTTSGDFNFTVDDGASNSAAAADFTITVNAVLSTSTVDTSSSISVYPNPVNDDVTVTIDNTISGNVTIEIISTVGQTVFTSSDSKAIDSSEINLDLSALASGTYILRVSQGNHVGIQKIIKK